MIHEAILQSITEGEPRIGYLHDIQKELKENPRTIVVLDDDPTGTQTVHNVPVITQWSPEVIDAEVQQSNLFFILTNSRSLQAEEANTIGKLIGERLQHSAKKHHKKLLVISRGDSTLRGHYPNEVDALATGLGLKDSKHLVVPAFFEGGRYTFNDIHYVREDNKFIPAAETPFAKDSTFGYTSSNLKEWIQEKTNFNVKINEIASFSIATLRGENINEIATKLNGPQNYFISNATTYGDLGIIALAALKSKNSLIFRTAASFVNAIAGIAPKEPLKVSELKPIEKSNGGLILVGSYVPKTSQQLAYAKENLHAFFVELNIHQLINSNQIETDLKRISQQIDNTTKQGKTVVVYTGRKVITGGTKEESLAIVNRVSNFLVTLVQNLRIKPDFIIAKGGITSSDVAVKGLGVQRANVVGQITKGVPVWKLGNETKFKNIPYIIFPGNVGDKTTLYTLIKSLE